MRVKRQLAGCVLLGSAALITTAIADSPLLTLTNNPFTRPQMLKVKPAPVKVQVVRKTEPVDLDLTATMVSDNAPMIIVWKRGLIRPAAMRSSIAPKSIGGNLGLYRRATLRSSGTMASVGNDVRITARGANGGDCV